MDSMVKTTMAIEREIKDARSIRDAGANGKRKEDQPSSSLGKKRKTYIPRGFPGRGHSHQSQSHIRAPSQPGSMTCFHYHRPRHVKRDCWRSYGTP